MPARQQAATAELLGSKLKLTAAALCQEHIAWNADAGAPPELSYSSHTAVDNIACCVHRLRLLSYSQAAYPHVTHKPERAHHQQLHPFAAAQLVEL